MAFDGLGDKLQDIFKRMKGQGKISEKDLKAVMREVKVALLEADVNYKVVKQFVDNVNSRAVGEEVMESLTPGQQVVKIVHDELTQLLGGTQSKLTISPKPPTVIMMVGLQGSGKTTTSGKLGRLLKKQGKRPLLTACDVYRPAAIKQLQVLGEQLDIPVFTLGDKISPVDIAKA
ncbi:MAG: signal recognition particle receptor subunit alpha, partial [Peptococcaceae bacterium]|nr:signal recognition particle receptor subunit alpha [Peptococcaceae bacterium]